MMRRKWEGTDERGADRGGGRREKKEKGRGKGEEGAGGSGGRRI